MRWTAGSTERVAAWEDSIMACLAGHIYRLFLVATGDTNGLPDIFVRDLLTGKTTRVSVDSLGRQANGPSYSAAISADGRFVAFESDATNLVMGDTNGKRDVFAYDMTTRATTRV